MDDAYYVEPEIIASKNQGCCPTCISSEDGYCSMWRMGVSEPSCPLYEPRHEEADHE